MKRGLPRPMMDWNELKSFRFSEEEQKDWRSRPRRLPVPYSSYEDDLARLHTGRVKDCTSFRNCIVCGDWCPDDKVWAYINGNNGWVQDSGPFHEKCMKMTVKLCPMVKAHPDAYAFQEISWAVIGPIIRGKRTD